MEKGISIIQPSSEDAKLAAEVGGFFLSFVGGIVTATWKLKGIVDRLSRVEEVQRTCQSGPLSQINTKLDYIIQEGLPDVHKRIDAVLLKEK